MLRLLPCAHFHTVFTIPHELLPLWAFNRSVLTQLLFDCARSSLLELMADPRRLGVLPGLLMSLHTWGRNLSYHPHLHCLVTAGGLSEAGAWKSSRSHVPLSAMPLKALFRGKFLGSLGQALRHKCLHLPACTDTDYWRTIIRQLYRKSFNVRVGDVYEHGHGVALYLARYVKGGPLPRERPLFLQDKAVRFEYTDHRDHKTKSMQLPVEQFIDRVLWHAPPKGQHVTRHAGLYSTPHQAHHQQALDQLMLLPGPALRRREYALNKPPPLPPEAPRCPHCRLSLFRSIRTRPPQLGESSLRGTPEQHISRSHTPRAPPAMSNPSFKLTRHGRPPGPRGAQVHDAPRGPGVPPRRAA